MYAINDMKSAIENLENGFLGFEFLQKQQAE
jgi:hypothetical protein